jgi:hypothetical protein
MPAHLQRTRQREDRARLKELKAEREERPLTAAVGLPHPSTLAFECAGQAVVRIASGA